MAENFKVQSQSDKPLKDMPSDYWNRGVEGFVSKWGYALHSAANWRFFALGMLAANVCLIASVTYFATRSTLIPYIVEVDNSTGAVISTSKMMTRSEANRKEIEYFLWQLVKKTRTLPKDMVIYAANWKDAYAFMDSATAAKMNDMAVKEKHQDKLKQGVTTMLTLKTMTPLAGRDDTYNVRWTETHYSAQGGKIGEYELEGFFSIRQGSLSEETIYSNPLGLVVVDFNMSQLVQ